MLGPKFLASVYLAIAVAGVSASTPHRYATRRVHNIGRGLKVESFHPKTTYEVSLCTQMSMSWLTDSNYLDLRYLWCLGFAKRAGSTVQESTIALVEEKTGVSAGDIKLTSSAETENGAVVYVRQQHNDIKFANAVANAAFNKNSKVVAFGSSSVKPDGIASSTPKISQQQAIKVAVKALGGAYNKKPIGLEYVSPTHSGT
jgi:extracellular elastinolytic metalloproteinase